MTQRLRARGLLFSALSLLSAGAFAHDGDHDDLAWVVVRDANSTSMHGDVEDLRKARQHLKELGPGYLWFRREGKEYLVRDAKAIEEIEEVARPQEELGEEQARLGRRQSELGREQSRIGHRQGELGREEARRALSRARRDLDGKRPAQEEREDEGEMRETQKELSRAQQTLGREQEKIGREQARLGHEQQRLSKEARRKVEEVIEASLKNGSAKRLD